MINAVLKETQSHFHWHQIVCPTKQGWPIARKRLWGVLVQKEALCRWGFGDPQGAPCSSYSGEPSFAFAHTVLTRLMRLFERNRTEIFSYHDFLMATQAELDREFQWQSSRPTVTPPEYLNRSEKKHLEAYKKKLGAEHSATSLQLNQNPAFRAMHGGELDHHTLIKNVGILWIFGRSMTPIEMSLFLGCDRF